MSNEKASTAIPKRGKRHPLLLQQRLNEEVFWPSLLILAVSGALLVWNPAQLVRYRSHLAAMLFGTGLLLVLTLIFRLMAFAQCREDGLWIRLPFYHLIVPYARIKATRPTEFYHLFPPKEQHWGQRVFLGPLWGRTLVVIDLDELPASRARLRLWMSKYMLSPYDAGLAVPVRDWIAFRSEIDECKFRSQRVQNTYK
jgi:hypothetical protein